MMMMMMHRIGGNCENLSRECLTPRSHGKQEMSKEIQEMEWHISEMQAGRKVRA